MASLFLSKIDTTIYILTFGYIFGIIRYNIFKRINIIAAQFNFIGFGVFQTASMSNVGHFGTLVAVTVVFALLVDLIYTPAVLRAFFRSGVSVSDHAMAVAATGDTVAKAEASDAFVVPATKVVVHRPAI